MRGGFGEGGGGALSRFARLPGIRNACRYWGRNSCTKCTAVKPMLEDILLKKLGIALKSLCQICKVQDFTEQFFAKCTAVKPMLEDIEKYLCDLQKIFYKIISILDIPWI